MACDNRSPAASERLVVDPALEEGISPRRGIPGHHVAGSFDGEEADALVLDDASRSLAIVLPVAPVSLDGSLEARDPALGADEGHCRVGVAAEDQHLPVG